MPVWRVELKTPPSLPQKNAGRRAMVWISPSGGFDEESRIIGHFGLPMDVFR
jgi:hypothetical protein